MNPIFEGEERKLEPGNSRDGPGIWDLGMLR
jgi:hypothetical protein